MSIKSLAEEMADHPFFADMAKDDLELIAGCGRNVAYAAGDFLFKTGGQADHFFLIRRGLVALELAVPGADVFRFETLGPDEVAGWSWLLPPHKWQFDARALEDTGVVLFDGACLRGKCDEDPRLGYDLLKRFAQVLARRFADTRLQLIDVYGQHNR